MLRPLRLPFVALATLVALGCGGATEGSETLPLEFRLLSTSPADPPAVPATQTDRPALVGSTLLLTAATTVRDGTYRARIDDTTVVSGASVMTACHLDRCEVQVSAKAEAIGFATIEVHDEATDTLLGVIRLHIRRPSAVGVKAHRAGAEGFEDVSSGLTLRVGERVDLYPFATDGGGTLVAGPGGFHLDFSPSPAITQPPAYATPFRVVGAQRGSASVVVSTASGPSRQLTIDVTD